MRLKVISTLLMVLLPSMGHSIAFNTDLSDFSPYDGVKFILADEVSGGCFTNLGVVEDYARSKIALSGMELTEQDDFRYRFIVQAMGRSWNGYCQGQITVGLYSVIEIWNGERGLVTIKEIGYTFQDKSFNDKVLDQIGRFFQK
jgi:hypothetical protein